jgi:excisionase family DNA binding protein
MERERVKREPKVIEGTTNEREALIRLLEAAGLAYDQYRDLDEPLLTTSEVALILRTSPRTVRNWADGGKIRTIRSLGGRRLFPASAVLLAVDSMVRRRPAVEGPDRAGTDDTDPPITPAG